jgi:hypothetical protein
VQSWLFSPQRPLPLRPGDPLVFIVVVHCEQDAHSSERVHIGFCPLPNGGVTASRGKRGGQAVGDEDTDLWAPASSHGPVSTHSAIPVTVLAALRVDRRRTPSGQMVHCIACARKSVPQATPQSAAGVATTTGSDVDEAKSLNWFGQRFRDVLVGLGLVSEEDDDDDGDRKGRASHDHWHHDSDGLSPATSASTAAHSSSPAPSTAPSRPAQLATSSNCIPQKVWFGVCDECLGE